MVAAHVVVVVAALVATVTGYGFVVLSAPLLALVLPPHQVVPLALTLGWVLVSALLARPGVRRSVDWRLTAQLSIGGVAGIPIGAWLLTTMDATTLRVSLGVTSSVFALASLSGAVLPTGGSPAAYGTGFVSGILSGCVGLSGPPLAMHLAAAGASKAAFRATAAAVVWILTAATLALFAASGLLTTDLPLGVASLLPALAVGGLLGRRVFPLLSLRRFRQAALGLAFAAGVITVAAGSMR